MHITKHDIEYGLANYSKAIIPKGTEVFRATNLPDTSEIKYWAEPWEKITEQEQSHARTYGFGIEEKDVEENNHTKEKDTPCHCAECLTIPF